MFKRLEKTIMNIGASCAIAGAVLFSPFAMGMSLFDDCPEGTTNVRGTCVCPVGEKYDAEKRECVSTEKKEEDKEKEE